MSGDVHDGQSLGPRGADEQFDDVSTLRMQPPPVRPRRPTHRGVSLHYLLVRPA